MPETKIESNPCAGVQTRGAKDIDEMKAMTLGPNIDYKYWRLDVTPTRIDFEVSVAPQCVSTPSWLFPPESCDPLLAG